jgi:transcriptional regulator with XRE-family HTH domain
MLLLLTEGGEIMNKIELDQCNRFKLLRKELNIKQNEFAKELAISQGHASDIENGRKAVSDRIIEILVLKYDVNEDWLRNGGNDDEMFIKKTRTQEISEFAGKLLKEKDSFRRKLVEALAQLDEEEWKLLENIAKKMVSKKD